MPTINPRMERNRRGSYLETTARATVNRHIPEIVVYVIDSGRYYYVSDTRTGIDGIISRHRDPASAEARALKIVWDRFNKAMTDHKKRVTLYG